MAQFFSIHPTHPQARLVRRGADIVRAGGLVAYPTDSCYALGCKLGDAKALGRLRRVRGIDERHHLTLMCRDLSEIANYALVDDARFQLLKRVTPGSYTFILRARRQVPRRSTHPQGRMVRRAADIVRAGGLVAYPTDSCYALGCKLGDAKALVIRERLERELDLVIDAGPCGVEPSTVIDLTGDVASVLRRGKGSLEPFAVEPV